MLAEVDMEKQLLSSLNSYLLKVVVIVCVLVFGLGGWAAFTRISGAVVSMGTIVVESNTKKIQHQEGGIVREIMVENGDLVNAGDLLIRLDDTVIRSNLELTLEQLDVLYAKKSRLITEHSGDEEIDFSVEGSEALMTISKKTIRINQTNLFRARKRSLSQEIGQLLEKVAQLNYSVFGFRSKSEALEVELKLVGIDLINAKQLFEKRLISKVRVTELERDKVNLEGEIGVIKYQIAQNKRSIVENKLNISQIKEEYLVDIYQQLQEARINVAHLEKEKVSLKDRLKRLNIRAVRAGYIHDLSVFGIGGVISPSEVIMFLVPENDVLLVEAKIRPVDIDQLSLGQKARVRFSSFDQRTTPELSAELKIISADLLQDQRTGDMYYQARFTISESELSKLSGKSLIPGLPVEVFASTESRTVFSYLLKPVSDQIAHALRER